ncbi:MAG: tyrosine-type recombinase/integrase, partial [Planctomycetales bacterium]|nr:tyrosine-type recombinase/integrase [Planctomycetales bacterium]
MAVEWRRLNMAGIEQRSGRFNVIFRFGGKRFVRSLKTSDEGQAIRRRDEIQETIDLVERGKLQIPLGAEVVTFLMSGGSIASIPKPQPVYLLSQVIERFFDHLMPESLEVSTVNLMQLHCRHVQRILGNTFKMSEMAKSTLEDYARKRSTEIFRGKRASGATIRKELATFRTVWNWAHNNGLVAGDFPSLEIRLPKSQESLPFQTWDEIERQIELGCDNELWDCLYLDMDQISALLRDVTLANTLPCMHAMIATAAYTGARRSELLRCEMSDIDLESKMLQLREKKRVRGKRSVRRVPVAAPLENILRAWLSIHPGGRLVFCHYGELPWSRSRGNLNGAIEWRQASHFLRQTLKNGRWKVIKGWHTFRHSFISNCASKGVDQRMIDAWV